MRKCRCYLCYIFEVTSVSFYNKTKLAQVGQIIQFKQSWQKIVCLKSEKVEEVGRYGRSFGLSFLKHQK